MQIIYKKIQRNTLLLYLLAYIAGFICFIAFRSMNITFFMSVLLMLLCEFIFIMGIQLYQNVKFINAINIRTKEMMSSCQALPYIKELENFLKDTSSLSKMKRIQIEIMLANGYRFYGDFSQALSRFQRLSIQDISDLQRFHMKICEFSIYLHMEDIAHAQQHLHAIMSYPKKERFFQMKNMQSLAMELTLLEAYLKYLNKEVSANDYLHMNDTAHQEFNAKKVWQLQRKLTVLKREVRDEEAAAITRELQLIAGDFLILHPQIRMEAGEWHA